MEIYYEYDPVTGVQVTYDYQGERHYDYFKSLGFFKCWASSEFSGVELVEITNDNYQQLAREGKI